MGLGLGVGISKQMRNMELNDSDLPLLLPTALSALCSLLTVAMPCHAMPCHGRVYHLICTQTDPAPAAVHPNYQLSPVRTHTPH